VQICKLLEHLKSVAPSNFSLFEIAAPSQTTTSTSSIWSAGIFFSLKGFISTAEDFLLNLRLEKLLILGCSKAFVPVFFNPEWDTFCFRFFYSDTCARAMD
jgi:hypothetical protein